MLTHATIIHPVNLYLITIHLSLEGVVQDSDVNLISEHKVLDLVEEGSVGGGAAHPLT